MGIVEWPHGLTDGARPYHESRCICSESSEEAEGRTRYGTRASAARGLSTFGRAFISASSQSVT
jgi:hypothetical protein